MLSTLHSSLDNTKNHIRNATINAKTTQQQTGTTTTTLDAGREKGVGMADDDVQADDDDDDDDADDVATTLQPAGGHLYPLQLEPGPTLRILSGPCDAFDMHEQQRQAGNKTFVLELP